MSWRQKAWGIVLSIQLGAFLLQGAGDERTQRLNLQKGWNAVFLEVQPANPDPAAVFAGLPVDIVASYFSRSSSAQFLVNPGAEMFKKAGWGVWYSEARPDAFLKTLHAIHGQQAYLIHASADAVWSVPGKVTILETVWEPNAFNFVGFGVHAQAAPTFAQFFAGSAAHQHTKFYRLANGVWRRVVNPAAETMRSGEAFWTYCEGRSTYQGPVRIETSSRQGLFLSGSQDKLTLRNESGHPVTPALEHVVEGASVLPLAVVITVVGETNRPTTTTSAGLPPGAWTQPLPPLETAGSMRIPFELRLESTPPGLNRSLLKLTTDLGTEMWIPVTGVRKDLSEN